MSLQTDLDALFTSGFDQLYPIYGAVIDIVEQGSGDPYLLIQGSVEDLDKDIKALVFPVSVKEKEIYGTGFGFDVQKFLFGTDIGLKTSYLIRKGADLYEIFAITDRKAFNKYRVIGKKSEDV